MPTLRAVFQQQIESRVVLKAVVQLDDVRVATGLSGKRADASIAGENRSIERVILFLK